MADVDVIETPEHVELQRPLAGIGSRFLAGLVDHLLLILLVLVLIVLFIVLGLTSLTELTDGMPDVRPWALALLILAFFVIYWGYFVLLEMLMNGQTPGKRRMRIRVMKEGGGAAGAADIAIRNLLRPVDGLAGYGLAGVSMFLTRRVQRLGDLAAGTVVVSEQLPNYAAKSDKRRKVEWRDDASADALRATGLQPEEYSALSNYWARRAELSLEARERILPRLLAPVLTRAGGNAGGYPFAVLEAYVEALLAKARDEAIGAGASTEGDP